VDKPTKLPTGLGNYPQSLFTGKMVINREEKSIEKSKLCPSESLVDNLPVLSKKRPPAVPGKEPLREQDRFSFPPLV
jgi:hypothetical protein